MQTIKLINVVTVISASATLVARKDMKGYIPMIHYININIARNSSGIIVARKVMKYCIQKQKRNFINVSIVTSASGSPVAGINMK